MLVFIRAPEFVRRGVLRGPGVHSECNPSIQYRTLMRAQRHHGAMANDVRKLITTSIETVTGMFIISAPTQRPAFADLSHPRGAPRHWACSRQLPMSGAINTK